MSKNDVTKRKNIFKEYFWIVKKMIKEGVDEDNHVCDPRRKFGRHAHQDFVIHIPLAH